MLERYGYLELNIQSYCCILCHYFTQMIFPVLHFNAWCGSAQWLEALNERSNCTAKQSSMLRDTNPLTHIVDTWCCKNGFHLACLSCRVPGPVAPRDQWCLGTLGASEPMHLGTHGASGPMAPRDSWCLDAHTSFGSEMLGRSILTSFWKPWT